MKWPLWGKNNDHWGLVLPTLEIAMPLWPRRLVNKNNVSMNKVFALEVGIEDPWIGSDDTFEVIIEFTEDELSEIIQGGISLLRNDSMDIGTYDFIEVLSNSAYKKLNSIAEKVASEKWGEKMLIANGARYTYFLPDDIVNAIFDSNEAHEIYEKRRWNENLSHSQFKEDTKMLFTNHSNGRWKGKLLPDPHWGNQPFGGSWSGPSIGSFEKAFPVYGFHCTILLNGKETNIEYTVRYFLESYELELCVFWHDAKVVAIFEDILSKEGYSIKKRLPIGEPVYSYAIYSEGKNPQQFCSTYMNILDEIIKFEDRDY